MSYATLQRVVVRMLYDPALVAAVYRGDRDALGSLDLTAPERRWLVAQDPRAYATDPHRRGRTLTALLEELPVASALVVRAAGPTALDAFFGAARFHDAIQRRGSLAAAYAGWLQDQHGALPRERRLPPVVRLEAAIAAIRRARPTTPSGGPLVVTATTVAAVRVDGGTLAFRQAAADTLAAHRAGLVGGVLDKGARLPDRRLDPGTPEELLVERTLDDEVTVAEGSEALGEVLRACASPVLRHVALAAVRAQGAEEGEDVEILDGLIEDGLLSPSPG